MKIIVAGAGLTGTSIISYLSQSNNDLIVIDENLEALKDLAASYEIQTLHGSASHPEILKKAGAENADIIIAVTNYDEINMVACQVAHTIFNIPTKIARIDAIDFLEPLWANLYNEQHIPIDYIISPDVAIAENIYKLLKIPGANEVENLDFNNLKLIAFKIDKQSPLLKAKFMELQRIEPDLNISVLFVWRNAEVIIPSNEFEILENDVIYFLTKNEDVEIAIKAFGMQTQSSEHIIIFGSNKIASFLWQKIKIDNAITNTKFIEDDKNLAISFSKKYPDAKVINGSIMEDEVLLESDIENADTSIAITSKDKDNVLISLLAKAKNVPQTISLVNSKAYNNIVDNLNKNTLLNRANTIVSEILKPIRKPKLEAAYCLGKNCGEIWEIVITQEIKIEEFEKLKKFIIGAVCRENNILFDIPPILQMKDKIILFVGYEEIEKLEKLLA